jgi:hypothetical protein
VPPHSRVPVRVPEPTPSKDHDTGDPVIFIVKSLISVIVLVLLVSSVGIWWLEHSQLSEASLEQVERDRQFALLRVQTEQRRKVAEHILGQMAACLDNPCGCVPALQEINGQLATLAKWPD